MSTASKLERFSAGERFAVDPDAIERELASLWRAAGSSTAERNPVTRACLWNVVFHLEERAEHDGFGEARALTEIVGDLPRFLAARALVLRTASTSGPELESWISANCTLAGDGHKLVCSEEISFIARDQGPRHLPGLVRALLVPAVPTALVMAGVPETSSLHRGLLDVADRLVVSVDRSRDPQALQRLAALRNEARLSVIDIGWVEEAPFRALIAELFDAPDAETLLAQICRVEAKSPAKKRGSNRLHLGWVAAVLAMSSPRPAPIELEEATSEEGQALRFLNKQGHVLAEVRVGLDGRAELLRDGQTVGARTLMRTPGASLLAKCLVTRSADPSFFRALKQTQPN